MKLTCNQKIVLLLFIVAIVSVVFMEYTREYLDNIVAPTQPQQSNDKPTVGDHVTNVSNAVGNVATAVGNIFKH